MTTNTPEPPESSDQLEQDEPDELLADLAADPGDVDDGAPVEPEVRDNTLDALIREHRAHRINELWLREIRSAADRVARNYPPHRYRAGTAWDQHAIDDLCQDVVVRLMRKHQLEYICDTANDLPHARALLRRQVRLTLIDRRRRTAVDNLVGRALQRLAQEPFHRLGVEPDTWTLTPDAGHSTPADLDRTEFVRLSQRLRGLPRVRHTGVERASPIWPAETLLNALNDIVTTFGVVTRHVIEEILADALTFLNVAEFVDDEAGDQFVASDLGPEGEAVVNEIVTRTIESLTDDESAVLAHKFRGVTDEEIAEQVGRSRPTVASRRGSGAQKVRNAIIDLDLDTQNAVLERVQRQILEANK